MRNMSAQATLVSRGEAVPTKPLHRSASTKKTMKSPHECPFGPDLQKYWDRRYQYFTKFDLGIKTDAEGLYSVMPEDVADEEARRLNGKTVLDAFAGIGGSAIGFARSGKAVIAVDIDHARLEMARNNARVYGVADRITFIHGDFFDVAPSVQADAVNLDPPWGGPKYRNRKLFSLDDFTPSGHVLLDYCLKHFSEVMFRVPRNFDESELSVYGKNYTLYEDKSNGKIISRTVVFGLAERALAASADSSS